MKNGGNHMHRLLIGILMATGLLLSFLIWRGDLLSNEESAGAPEEASSAAPVTSAGTQRDKGQLETTPQAPSDRNPQASTSSSPTAKADALRELDTALSQGVINPGDYDWKRKRLLGEESLPPNPSSSTSSNPAPSVEETIQQLQTMFDQGLISREAYDSKRRILLGEDPGIPASAPSTSPRPSSADRLKELQSLLDQNLITREEYQTKRGAILKEM
jgi:hypothetical protein